VLRVFEKIVPENLPYIEMYARNSWYLKQNIVKEIHTKLYQITIKKDKERILTAG
jgi:hypothetical protein